MAKKHEVDYGSDLSDEGSQESSDKKRKKKRKSPTYVPKPALLSDDGSSEKSPPIHTEKRRSETHSKSPSKTSRSDVKNSKSHPPATVSWWQRYLPFQKVSSDTRDVASRHNRGHWTNKKEYILSCIGATVGLGNFWRFPSLVYKNGGGAFFIPYILLQVLVGTPLFFMELSLGQFIARGPTGVFHCNPTAKGIGITMALVSTSVSIYYNVILGYGVFYFFSSMTPTHPWSKCKQEWLKENCTSDYGLSIPKCNNQSHHNLNITMCKCTGFAKNDFNLDVCGIKEKNLQTYPELLVLSEKCHDAVKCTNSTNSAAHLYFYKDVIAMSPSISNMGKPSKSLVFCVYFMWILLTCSMYRGVKTSGKIVYFSVFYVVVVMVTLIIFQFTTEGSAMGIKYLLMPTWSKLKEIDVWNDAASQLFFSLNLGMGVNLMLGSYSRFHSNTLVDTLIVTNADILASFLSSLLVFSTLGSILDRSGKLISSQQIESLGLVFVTYPEAFQHLPGSNFWCMAFFLMVLSLGFHSQLALVQTSVTSIMDEYPILYRYKWLAATGICACFFLLGLPILCPGGIYVLNIMDNFCYTMPSIVIAFGEIVAIAGIYGIKNFLADVEYMIGYDPPPVFFWKYTLSFVTPVFLLTVLTLKIAFRPIMKYSDETPYETWAQVTGWFLFFGVIAPIPLVCVWKVFKADGDTIIEKMQNASEPSLKWVAQGQAMKNQT